MEKKLTMQLLSVGLVRFLFIVVMILGVSVASNRNDQKFVKSVDEKPVIAEAIISQSVEKIKHSFSSIKGNKAERLYHLIILQTASRYQVEPALVKAIIMAESGYNPKAISKRGAKGLMQLMPGTAQALGVEDIFNPRQNISGGVRYFKQLVNQFNGDIELALAAYNAGSKNVRHYQGIPPFKATHYYIKKVFEYYQIYKNQMAGEVDRA